MQPFTPSAEQRQFVAAMTGMRMTWEEIRLLVINPRTNEPISKETLQKAFAAELADGKAKLKRVISEKFRNALDNSDPWALQWGLKYINGWRDDGVSVSVGATGDDGEKQVSSIQVSFVHPKRSADDDAE
jgi:hypothetical protein